MRKTTIYTLAAIPLLVIALIAASALVVRTVHAHFVPAPCDFITGGGWVIGNSGAKVNVRAHGGCKHGAFWGHVNVLEHSVSPPAHLTRRQITGHLTDPAYPNP